METERGNRLVRQDETFVRNEIRYYADGRRVHLEGCDSIGGCWLTPDGERITPWKCNCSNKVNKMNINPLQLISLLLLAAIGGGVTQMHFAKKIAPASTSASLCSMATEYEVRHVSGGSPSVVIKRSLFRDAWEVRGANLDALSFPSADSAFEAYQNTLVQTDGGSRD